jgi:ATP-dependent DNA ligase
MKAPTPPSGEAWLHEIKHDGFRVIARKDGERVKLYSRPGNDLTAALPADSRLKAYRSNWGAFGSCSEFGSPSTSSNCD